MPKILAVLNVANLAADPATGAEGDIYYNSAADKFRWHNGTGWVDMDHSLVAHAQHAGVWVQPTDPGMTSSGIWVETGLGAGGDDYTIWIEDENPGGGPSGGGALIKDENVSVGTATAFNFTGAGVTATVTNGVANIAITSGGGTSHSEDHAARHASGGADQVTPAAIGAAAASHAAAHFTSGADPLTPANIGAAPSSHRLRHAIGGEDEMSPTDIGAATLGHNHSPSGPGATVVIDTNAEAGNENTYARAGHGHRLNTYSATPPALSVPGSPGTAGTAPARGNHTHPTTGLALSTHAAAHASGGGDPVTPAAIGAATSGHTHSLPANDHPRLHTVTNTADHTFPGGTATFLRADGTWADPAVSGGAPGRLLRRVLLTSGSAATFTVGAGATTIRGYMVGGGGGGGGAAGGTGTAAAGGGGAAGDYQEFEITSPAATYTYTVGAGGTAGTGNAAGSAGGSTSFGSFTAAGGGGGEGGPAVSTVAIAPGGAGSASPSGGTLAMRGSPGDPGFVISAGTDRLAIGGNGGAGPWGAGSRGSSAVSLAQTGLANSGAGGGGARSVSASNVSGSAGGSGLIILEEWA